MSNATPQESNPLKTGTKQNAGDVGEVSVEETLRYASDPSPEQAATLPTMTLTPIDLTQDYAGRCRQTLLLAEEAFAKTGSWVIFFREVLGVDGVVHRLFPDAEERNRFICSEQHATLQEMLAAIRSQDSSKSDAAEPERMITIRIPRSLHDLLKCESEARFIPEQQGRRRGRRPGPQGNRVKKAVSEVSEQKSESVIVSKEGWG